MMAPSRSSHEQLINMNIKEPTISGKRAITSSVRCSLVLLLALTLCSLVGTGDDSTTVVKPGGGLYTLQYAFS
jgi:hypothetical protein